MVDCEDALFSQRKHPSAILCSNYKMLLFHGLQAANDIAWSYA